MRQVTLQCGEQQTVVSVTEPKTCEYHWTVSLPQACSAEAMSVAHALDAGTSSSAAAAAGTAGAVSSTASKHAQPAGSGQLDASDDEPQHSEGMLWMR